MSQEKEPQDLNAVVKLRSLLNLTFNEPTVGLFRIQEHAAKTLPSVVHLKENISSIRSTSTQSIYDLDFSTEAVSSICNLTIFDELNQICNQQNETLGRVEEIEKEKGHLSPRGKAIKKKIKEKPKSPEKTLDNKVTKEKDYVTLEQSVQNTDSSGQKEAISTAFEEEEEKDSEDTAPKPAPSVAGDEDPVIVHKKKAKKSKTGHKQHEKEAVATPSPSAAIETTDTEQIKQDNTTNQEPVVYSAPTADSTSQSLELFKEQKEGETSVHLTDTNSHDTEETVVTVESMTVGAETADTSESKKVQDSSEKATDLAEEKNIPSEEKTAMSIDNTKDDNRQEGGDEKEKETIGAVEKPETVEDALDESLLPEALQEHSGGDSSDQVLVARKKPKKKGKTKKKGLGEAKSFT